MNKTLIFTAIISILPHSCFAHFLDERYRGWFWFEEKVEDVSCGAKIATFKEELEDRRNEMIVRPNVENVIRYIEWEEKMWRNAMKLDKAYRKARLLHPEYFNRLNVYGARIARREARKAMHQKLLNFAVEYDLLFFAKKDCPYSEALWPVARNFCKEYGFKLQRIQAGHEKVVPTIMAISKNKKNYFEITRGYVSKSELEEAAALASDIIN